MVLYQNILISVENTVLNSSFTLIIYIIIYLNYDKMFSNMKSCEDSVFDINKTSETLVWNMNSPFISWICDFIFFWLIEKDFSEKGEGFSGHTDLVKIVLDS